MPSRRAYLAGLAVAISGCSAPDRDAGTTTAAPTRTTTTTRPAVTGSWTHLDGTPGGTNSTDTPPLDATPALAWRVGLGGGHRPVRLVGDALYTATERTLTRRRLTDGGAAWTHEFERGARLTAAVDDRLYVTTGEQAPRLHALGVADGEPTEQWSRSDLRGRRADGDVVVATAPDNTRLAALEPDGTERWALAPSDVAEEAVRFGPVVLGADRVFAVVEDTSMAWVAGLARADGTVTWSAHDPNQNTVLAGGEDVVVSAGADAGATGFSVDGNSLWQVETDGPVRRAALADGRVYLGEEGGATRALTWQGDDLWSRTDARVDAADDGVVYALGDGVDALDVDTGDTRWRLDDAVDTVIPAAGGLFALRTGDDGTELRLYQ